MTESNETDESWVQTENTQKYTPDVEPESDESWVQTENTQDVDPVQYRIADM
jgi:hypothetical protein